MIRMYLGWDRCCKTISARALAQDLVDNAGYNPVVANMAIHGMPGAVCLTDSEMREWLKMMVVKKLRRQVVLIDEVDYVFPTRFWSDKSQTEALLGFWRAGKFDNQILLTAHRGTPTDKLIRDSTHQLIFPEHEPEFNRARLTVCDLRYGFPDCVLYLNNLSEWFDKYDSYE